jgi:hypothetical protein
MKNTRYVLGLVFFFLFTSACSGPQSSSLDSDDPPLEQLRADEVYVWLRDVIDEKPHTQYQFKHFPPQEERDIINLAEVSEFSGKLPYSQAHMLFNTKSEPPTDEEKVIIEVESRLTATDKFKLLTLHRKTYDRRLRVKSAVERLSSPFVISGYHDTDLLEDLMQNIQIDPKKISWDGVESRYVFHEEEFEEKIMYIASALVQDHPILKNIFENLSEERKDFFRINTNTPDASSKYEMFDLLEDELAEWKMGEIVSYTKQDLSPPSFSYAARKALERYFGLIDDASEPYFGMRFEEDEFMLVCTSNIFEYVVTGGFQVGSTGYFNHLKVTLEDLAKYGMKVKCGSDNWHTIGTKTMGPDLSLPIPDLADFSSTKSLFDPLRILINISLVNETDAASVAALHAVMKMYGYFLTAFNTEVDTLSTFSKEFVRSDMLVTAGHVLSPSNLNLGYDKSTYLEYVRLARSEQGIYLPVRLRIMLPVLNKSADLFPTFLSMQDLADLMHERRASRSDSMLMMNTTCYGADTLRGWTRAYMQAIAPELGSSTDLSPYTDAPIVIAAKRGFDTDHALKILSHMLYPLHVVDMLARGKNLDQVRDMLEKGLPETVTKSLFEEIAKYLDVSKGEPLFKSFEPVINRDREDLFNMSALSVVIYDANNQAVFEF